MPGPALEAIERPLTEQERELIYWLLDHGEVDTASFYQQINRITVFERCTCGCPTIYFAYDGTAVSRTNGDCILSDHYGLIGDMLVGVMLFEVDGILSSLEVYSCPGTDQPFGLPPLQTLYSVHEPPPTSR